MLTFGYVRRAIIISNDSNNYIVSLLKLFSNKMSKEIFETNCGTNSEPFALQNLGNTMEPEFSENCILIIDPAHTPTKSVRNIQVCHPPQKNLVKSCHLQRLSVTKFL
jgi:hypothetical protein